jgi:hypothetical protein
LTQEGGGQRFDRLQLGSGRLAGLLYRGHLLAQFPRDARLLRKGREGDWERF